MSLDSEEVTKFDGVTSRNIQLRLLKRVDQGDHGPESQVSLGQLRT